MDVFKITVHELADISIGGPIISPGTVKKAEDEMNEMRKTHLLYECKVVGEGRGLVCVWVKTPEGEGTHTPLGFRLV